MRQSFAVGIGGAAGQGVATPGDIFAKIFSRRGLHLNAYNAYQSIIRGGHTFLTVRTGPDPITNMGDRLDLLIPLNQDTVDRHLGLLGSGAACLYNADSIHPGTPAEGVQLCPIPVSKLADITKNKVAQNTLAMGAALSMMGVGFPALESALAEQFRKKEQAVIDENVSVARAGYDYATANFKPFAWPLPMTENHYAVLSGNAALAMGGAAAGVKFYCAYPMSPSTGVLHWMAEHARKAGIMVRQVEDEIGVINMAIGAAQAGVRSMCATSGGGFALMSEGLGLSAQAEIPVVVIDCQRAGPSTGVPTKTEQGDLWQMLGAAFGDYPRIIAAPLDIGDCFTLIPEIFNLADRFQCPAIVLCDLLLSEGRLSVDPKDLNFQPHIDRGELITSNGMDTHEEYKRYLITESGVSPRAIPGLPGYTHTVSSDEHDENGVLISDEYTNVTKRRAMMEKRMRKVAGIESAVPAPELIGPRDADVTLIGWGSTYGVIEEARELLQDQGISSNQLQIRWLVPLHGDAIVEILKGSKHTIIVENNYSGQFARYLRSETSFVPDGYIRKYDGEPFMPHHIVEAVKEQLAGNTNLSVPVHEIMV
ncbi:2-oxoglutarate ferredoxin oxidoreductase subunit alpha [Edaphobacter aggregans]|uniref:2-oxoglutarate ferredoxin oxidoreductase subunit alpha n=1 Tax=Edaphobacter aggregans TaxID=570835 RepID=A0A3R9QA62_9BACT|nr:2-oxoacid:acceptor oxidoreductase subunit alpha [Edaphobacter aggregans]RSL16322.1 2-oxoglutarate ferredoxin oxidoreductase subunit alpha [Edaphobacter aggregans]